MVEMKENKELFHVEQFQKTLLSHLKRDDFIENIQAYFKEYTLWNSRINLSTIRTESAFWIKHVLDSMVLAYVLDRDFKGNRLRTVIDLGTGGGFPGVVLALSLNKPTILLDKTDKKLKFLDEVLKSLNLESPKILIKKVNFIEQNLVKHLSLDPFHSVFVSRAVDIFSLSEFVKKQKIRNLYLMTTRKAFKNAMSIDKVIKNFRNIKTEIIEYQDVAKLVPEVAESFTLFSDYIILKMFHVEHF